MRKSVAKLGISADQSIWWVEKLLNVIFNQNFAIIYRCVMNNRITYLGQCLWHQGSSTSNHVDENKKMLMD